jgi:hypothetical protein
VLETQPIPDLLVPDLQARFLPPVRIERPRLRLTLLPDGTAKGILGGYIATSRLTSPQTDGDGETAKGVPCDGLWHALHNLADGARDPRTGECHAISAAFRIEALPAFIALPNSDRRH